MATETTETTTVCPDCKGRGKEWAGIGRILVQVAGMMATMIAATVVFQHYDPDLFVRVLVIALIIAATFLFSKPLRSVCYGCEGSGRITMETTAETIE